MSTSTIFLGEPGKRRLQLKMDNIQDTYITISVRNPITHLTDEGRFTSYLIYLETNNIAFSLQKSCIRRRYSEFIWLRNSLSKLHRDVTPPALPPKTYLTDRFDPCIIEDRKEALEKFLKRVLDIPQYLSNSLVHLFLQSPLSTTDMETCIAGTGPLTAVEAIVSYGRQCNANEAAASIQSSPAHSLAQPPSSLTLLPQTCEVHARECPCDIFSPTRPHILDIAHCLDNPSTSYDSTDGQGMMAQGRTASPAPTGRSDRPRPPAREDARNGVTDRDLEPLVDLRVETAQIEIPSNDVGASAAAAAATAAAACHVARDASGRGVTTAPSVGNSSACAASSLSPGRGTGTRVLKSKAHPI